jgi:NAD(P)-dependent dehydrogenase (short-subunit alcohol dehydrogenase family)
MHRNPNITMTYQKTVVITGADKGIGLAFVSFYQSEGWKVLATMISKELSKSDKVV